MALAEIFLSTEGKSPEEIAAVRTKADDLHNRAGEGRRFRRDRQALFRRHHGEGWRRASAISSAASLSSSSKTLFSSWKKAVHRRDSDQDGLRDSESARSFQAGLQPLDKVEGEITNKSLHGKKWSPRMRNYLAELREESYVMVKPVIPIRAAVAGATVIQEVAPTPDDAQEKEKETAAAES